MTTRLRCPHCGTPLQRAYGRHIPHGGAGPRIDDQAIHRRKDCPRCGARYETREQIVAVNRHPVPARSVTAQAAG